jgi:hypothetical protein
MADPQFLRGMITQTGMEFNSKLGAVLLNLVNENFLPKRQKPRQMAGFDLISRIYQDDDGQLGIGVSTAHP